MRSTRPMRSREDDVADQDGKSNEYVQLAAELGSCMAFQPKKWRRVLEQSTHLLCGDDANPQPRTAINGHHSSTATCSHLAVKSAVKRTVERPRSREEDDDHGDLPQLPPIHNAKKPSAKARQPTLAQYLNQPLLVDEILREAMANEYEHGTELEPDDNGEGQCDGGFEGSSANAEEDDDDTADNATYDAGGPSDAARPLVLPILSTVSPRTREGLARLPALTTEEMKALYELERLAEQGNQRHAMYKALQQVSKEKSAVRTVSRGFRHRKMATKLSPDKQAASVLAATQRIFKSPWNKRAALVGRISSVQQQRLELIQMALEDVNVLHIQVEVSPPKPKPSAFSVPPALPPGVRAKLKHDHYELVELQHITEVNERAAEDRVDQTLQEIKQWIPLEVIYEFGLGKFASPAQQRAATLLFRVGQRLKHNLVVQAIHQWKLVVAAMKRAAEGRAVVSLQCWWRQILAVRMVASRRRLQAELQRRQRALLQLLASKENKSAASITRAIRRYGAKTKRERRERREQAACRIQRFWRHQQAAWLALRHHLRQEKRRKAAIVIQRHGRGMLARRRRRLLMKIKQVERATMQREKQRAARSRERHRYGAVIAIQRAFRAWIQRRIAALRRRRAQFERDKVKILKVQAHYRGQQARRWVQKHRQALPKAVIVIQCAWRCYLARQTRRCVQLQRQAERDAEAAAIAEKRQRMKASRLALPAQLVKPTWNGLIPKGVIKSGKKDMGPSSREIAAATKLQALWRGKRLRRRLKHEHAREREMARRAVTRKRKEAATCIQRHVRGIQGRRKAWHMMVHCSASKIQSAWRGFTTRRELFRMRAALKAIIRMQSRYRTRRNQEILRHRNSSARRIQRGWRRAMGKMWLYKAVRRQQYLAEEHAMGLALMRITRKRVNDDLLLQSFIHLNVQILKNAHEVSVELENEDEIKSVQRSLYKLDSAKKNWKRRGYDGVWQELYRDISGNSFEIDNSHFARFLKAMPKNFINPRNFPIQTVDLIFAKMKEPKSRTIPFQRFNKAMAMVWEEKFVSAVKQPVAATTGNESPTHESKIKQDREHFLRFMHDFLLPSTLHDGKYRKLLEESCTQRLEWAANVLRRFANRIAGEERHHQFVVIYRQHKIEQRRNQAARVLQKHYRVYRFRATLKATLAQMFIEYVDYKGQSVRFEHIETHRSILIHNSRRPAFLRGVRCNRVIPLPFPGEEFHAFCERHESASDPYKKVAASVYCVECEDAMCAICFARDHDKRAAFRAHEMRSIAFCSHCKTETATRECLHCGDGKVPFCDVCFPFVHKDDCDKDNYDETASKTSKAQHRYRRLVVACVECDDKVAQWMCDVCEDVFCKRCLSIFHAKGQRQSHQCHRLSYFSILRQKAELKRQTEAQKLHDQRRREREARRAAEERERLLREASATKIQAWVRSFQTRQRGKAYMKLVRQTIAAKAQRMKDERIRSSWGYKIKRVVGLNPKLKSDTQDEIEAKRQRIDKIKRTLFFYRNNEEEDDQNASKTAGALGKSGKNKKRKKRWTKRARAAVEKAARCWLVYGMQVKIVRGSVEWKDCVGSILSTQNLFNTGHVLVFLPLANRSVVVKWDDILPYDEDEILRQPHVSSTAIVRDATLDFRGKLSRVVEATARRAKLLYLQTIEFHDVVQYAWIVEFNKFEQKEEFWNVVLNKRTFNVPKAMVLIERMEAEERDRVDKRVALAKRKLVQLLNPYQPLDKTNIATRRHAVVPLPAALKRADNDSELHSRLRVEAEALRCARFWQETIVADAQFGGKHANRFLAACSAAPRSTKECWIVVQLLEWIELQDSDAFAANAKEFFKKTDECQVYIVNELTPTIEARDFKEARANFERLLKLKEETLQLLISKAQQENAAKEDADGS